MNEPSIMTTFALIFIYLTFFPDKCCVYSLAYMCFFLFGSFFTIHTSFFTLLFKPIVVLIACCRYIAKDLFIHVTINTCFRYAFVAQTNYYQILSFLSDKMFSSF